MGINGIIDSCRGNSICIVESFKKLIDQGYEAPPEEVKNVSKLLGEPTKKIDVFNDKYLHVFMKYVQRNCVEIGDGELCIYSWKPGTYVRYFPVSLDSTGTILYLSKDKVLLIAYPTHRSYDIEGHKVQIPDPSINSVVEISKRIDGYQITFYYNEFLKRWVPATRYVLHNMMYVKRRLEIASIEEIINPYAYVADQIAEKTSLYNYLKKYRGYTFTFILEPPEPAILRPNIELYNIEEFKLYLLNAREPNGRLLSISESRKLIEWDIVPLEEIVIEDKETLEKYISMWRNDLYVRSRFIRFKLDEPYRPYVLEVSSKLYSEAVAIKYYSSPKSLLVLASHGYGDEAIELLVDYGDIRSVGRELINYYNELKQLIPKAINNEWFIELLEKHGIYRALRGELEKAKRKGEYDRFIRKLAITIASNDLGETRDKLRVLCEYIKKYVSPTS
ncbi:MAG: hypothetical protein B6U89_02325 [Desulfurococcales archaeon ex4484_58]|nr:MAG: hypothetical protein B6U89_02325 [Desulfurococcales archaeon ex4484_58]